MTEPTQGFVSSYTNRIPQAQRKYINSLLEEKRKQGFIVTKSQRDGELEVKLESARDNNRFFLYSEVAGTITSDFFNKSFEDIQLDLRTLYSQLGVVSSDRSRIQAVTADGFIKTRAAINTIIAQLKLFRFLRNNPQYQDGKFVDFNTAQNESKLNPKAVVDVKTKVLKLPVSRQNRFSQGRFNLDKTVTSVEHIGGGITSTDNNELSTDNAIDTNPENFWAEIVLTDGIPSHKILLSHYSSTRSLGSGRQEGRTFYSNGIVFDFRLKFHRTIRSNNLRLLPIADYPLRVLDISFKTSDLSKEWITIPGFDPANYEETLDWIEWNGPQTHMSEVRLLLEQQNYTTNIYQIPTDLLANNQLWTQIVDKTFNEVIHNVALDEVLADKIAADPSSLNVINEFRDLDSSINSTSLIGEGVKIYDVVDRIQALTTSQLTRIDPKEGAEFVNSVDGVRLQSTAPLTETKRLQFMGGIRVLEVNDFIYDPFAVYESQRFETDANILEVSIVSNENNQLSTDAIGPGKFKKTSVEYEIEVGENVRIPIANAKDISNSSVEIKDELLIVNRQTYKGITRFFVNSSTFSSPAIKVRKNGNRLSPFALNSGAGGNETQTNYTATYVNVDGDSYIEVEFNRSLFDPRATYTVSYYAHTDAAIVNINDRFNSIKVVEPEEYTTTDRDNKVTLNYYPYIEYQIINDETLWRRSDQKWEFIPAENNYSIGTISLTTGDLKTINGTETEWTGSSVLNMVTGSDLGISGASIKIVGDVNSYTIASVTNSSTLVLDEDINLNFLPSGTPPTGLSYTIGKTKVIDGITYGLGNTSYEPLSIFVNDVKAINRTNYETLEHQAFVPQSQNTNLYEFIQVGKNIYFNTTINAKIEVDYRYLTEYLKLNALLRSHKVVNPSETPTIENYTLRIRNSKI